MREALASEPARVTDFLRPPAGTRRWRGGYLFRPFQLSHFDWVPADAAATVAEVLEEHLPTHRGGADVRSVDVRYERRYDVSFRFGAPIVTIIGAADVVTAAEPRGEIFEVKCVKKLLPEHILQLALYQWLDAFGRVQARVRDARARRRERSGPSSKSRPSRGVKGTGKDKREYTEEEASGPLELLDLYEKAGGDASKMLRRATLLNARTGETRSSRADARTLTRAVLTLVDHRLRIGRGGDGRRISSRGGGGGGGDARAERGRGRVRRDAGGEPKRRRDEEAQGRRTGGGEAQTPKTETNDADGDDRVDDDDDEGDDDKSEGDDDKATKPKSSAGFVFVGGKSREGGFEPTRARRRGRASTARPSPRGETVVGYRRRRVRRGGCLLTAAGENTSVARNGTHTDDYSFTFIIRRYILLVIALSYERRTNTLASPPSPSPPISSPPLPREEHGVQATPPDGSTTTTGRISQLFGHLCVSALTSGEHPSWSVAAPNSLSIAAMNALCVTTATCCSGRRITHSMNLCARSHIASLDSFMVPQRASFSSVTSEKSTPGKASRHARVSRRRSHGLRPMCSRHSSHARKGSARACGSRRGGDGGMTGADAILGSGGAHQRRRRDVAPGSILGMGDLGRRGEMFAAEGADGGLEGAHQGETTTSSILSRSASLPSCVVALSRWDRSAAHWSQPRGVKCASANCSDR